MERRQAPVLSAGNRVLSGTSTGEKPASIFSSIFSSELVF
ncbi:hypothetical protein HMPREF0294_1928 [Corynebacterium glucuronolyticum ATCC 51867]|nr:hypothetical protein HMPREF0294_1928 [Corynebacterium glucuronolyticum ATCC 51867]